MFKLFFFIQNYSIILFGEDKMNLKIINLSAKIDNKQILNNFNIDIKPGEIHAIMGPNGTGKSTLTKIIMRDTNYKVTKGDVLLDNESILKLSTDEVARKGVFLGMQLPMEIEGVSNADFLRSACKNSKDFNLYHFIKELNQNIDYLHMDNEMIHRSINVGFSGGEKKKNEILQMYMLKPSLILLDEIDSGLDVDSLKIIGEAIMNYYKEYKPAILLVTHYKRLLEYIKPEYVHIMKNGTIIKTGNYELVDFVEKNGYESFNSTNIVKENI